MRILHIEDDPDLRKFIKQGLKQEGFAVDGAADAKEGVQLAAENIYDIILMDLAMPGMSGIWAIRSLRQGGQTVGIFVISGLDAEADKLAAYDAGADDYMVKPIFLWELVAKIRHWMRRRDNYLSSDAPSTLLEAGPIRLDLLKHKATVNAKWIPLTPKEFMVLEYLMRHTGRVVTQTAIAQAVWSLDYDTGTNVVEFHIAHLRKKIDDEGKPSLIKTVRGSGYMLEPDEQDGAAPA